MDLYIGLMSGTSMDGIDAALVDVSTHQLISGITIPYPEQTKCHLLQIIDNPLIEIKSFGMLNSELGEAFGNAALAVIEESGVPFKEINAIGSHGQTIYHDPFSSMPSTLQLGCAHRIAEKTNLPVIADFRTRDMVLGGQGAPFAPLYHQILFNQDAPLAIINIGGIANITYLIPDQPTIGYDIGPGNVLLDAWCKQNFNKPYDENGLLATQGKVIPSLMHKFLQDPYFAEPPPKSIGKEYFLKLLKGLDPAHKARDDVDSPFDVQTTLVALTAEIIANDILQNKKYIKNVLICGGGVHNLALMQALKNLLLDFDVQSTEQKGISPDFLEAMMFAWLASQYIGNKQINLMPITGSSKPVRLGVYYPAG